jgi:hypothetical protein
LVNGGITPVINSAPGEKYVHIWYGEPGKSVSKAYKKIDVYIDVLTVVTRNDSDWETYPRYTTPQDQLDDPDAKATVSLYNGCKDNGNIVEILVANYGDATRRYIYETIRDEVGYKEVYHWNGTLRATQTYTFELKPGLYRLALKKEGTTAKYDYYGRNLWNWKIIHVRDHVPLVMSFDGTDTSP